MKTKSEIREWLVEGKKHYMVLVFVFTFDNVRQENYWAVKASKRYTNKASAQAYAKRMEEQYQVMA